MDAWTARKGKLEHDWAILGWVLSVDPEVRVDVRERITGDHRDAVERLIVKLHTHPSPKPNRESQGMGDDKLIRTFWNEYKDFDMKRGKFDQPKWWNSPDCRGGRSYAWHEMLPLPRTVVLGFMGCRGTSKNLGQGTAEQSWGDVKEIKSGKRSNLEDKSTEMRGIVYTTARVKQARIKQLAMEKVDASGGDAMFGDHDLA